MVVARQADISQDMHYAEFAEDEVSKASIAFLGMRLTCIDVVTERGTFERHQRIRDEQVEEHRCKAGQTCQGISRAYIPLHLSGEV